MCAPIFPSKEPRKLPGPVLHFGTEMGAREQEVSGMHALRTSSVATARHILIVEDDPDLQWRLARSLTVRGHRVVGSSSGEGALALARSWHVDIALVAYRLSGLDGPEVIRALREHAPSVHGILMAREVDSELYARAASCGAMAAMVKPVATVQLFETLEALERLRTPRAATPATGVPSLDLVAQRAV